MIALSLGAVIARGSPQEVMSNEHVVSAYLGSAGDSGRTDGDRAGRRAPSGVSFTNMPTDAAS
jgi:hypothetical protein